MSCDAIEAKAWTMELYIPGNERHHAASYNLGISFWVWNSFSTSRCAMCPTHWPLMKMMTPEVLPGASAKALCNAACLAFSIFARWQEDARSLLTLH